MDESVDNVDIALSAKLILEAANLLREDAEDYVDGIEGGEGTYKDIDDIYYRDGEKDVKITAIDWDY